MLTKDTVYKQENTWEQKGVARLNDQITIWTGMKKVGGRGHKSANLSMFCIPESFNTYI